MIIVMNKDATQAQIDVVVTELTAHNLQATVMQGTERIVIGAVGDERSLDAKHLETLAGIEKAVRIVKQYKMVSREFHQANKIINVRGVEIGSKQIQIIGGPCAVETPEQMDIAAKGVVSAGCRLMRGGAFKPRSSPYSFQGLGVQGLALLKEISNKYQLPIITELMDVRMLDTFLKYDVDIIQIGTRNMQNFDLLKEVGMTKKPVVLKRGMSATISEWLMAAEYIAAAGNDNIILCERGVRTFETAYRNMLDISAILVAKRESHLPVIVDPSHSGGKTWMVRDLALASIAAGADGLLVDMHPNPREALCDADQALLPEELASLVTASKTVAEAIGRSLP